MAKSYKRYRLLCYSYLGPSGPKSLFETPTLLLNSASDHPRQFAASLAFV
jgi:hypothetical protein